MCEHQGSRCGDGRERSKSRGPGHSSSESGKEHEPGIHSSAQDPFQGDGQSLVISETVSVELWGQDLLRVGDKEAGGESEAKIGARGGIALCVYICTLE